MTNLLRPQQSTSSNGTYTIHKAHISGWWLVKDSRGKLARVSSSDLWRKGDRVSVVDGRIVGTAGNVKESSVYEV